MKVVEISFNEYRGEFKREEMVAYMQICGGALAVCSG